MSVLHCVMNELGLGSISHAEPPREATLQSSVGRGGSNLRDDALSVQTLLNIACARVSAPRHVIKVDGLVGPITIGAIQEFQQAQLGKSDGRVDPGQRTIQRLNAIASQTPGTSVGPSLGVTQTAKDKALEAVPMAKIWTTGAFVHLSALRVAHLKSNLDPKAFAVANTHFHLDRAGNEVISNIDKLTRIFTMIMTTLNSAATYFQDGPTIPNFNTADAPVGGYNLPGTVYNRITFRPGFTSWGGNARSAALVHECAHFVGAIGEIDHFATEFPIYNGAPQGSGHTRNYANLETKEALCNAASYAAFAIHAATSVDSRFGARDLAQ